VLQKEHLALASGWKRQEVPNAGLVDAITTTDVSAEQGKSGRATNLGANAPGRTGDDAVA